VGKTTCNGRVIPQKQSDDWPRSEIIIFTAITYKAVADWSGNPPDAMTSKI